MSNFNCWNCSQLLPSPDDGKRYCPFCGFAYVIPCSQAICANNSGSLIFVGQNASCKTCGTLYRYDTVTRQAVRVSSDGAFVSKSNASQRLVDFDPVADDPMQANAFRLHHDLTHSLPSQVQQRLNVPLSAIGTRHGRIYAVIAPSGLIKAWDSQTLEPMRAWQQETCVPNWKSNPAAADVSIQITATLVLVRSGSQLFGFDAATGGQSLLDLPLLPEDPLFSGYDETLLCRQSTAKLSLYSLPALITSQHAPVAPLQTWDIASVSNASSVSLPPNLLLHYLDRALVIDTRGAVICLNFATGKHIKIYENLNLRSLKAWTGNGQQCALLYEPAATDIHQQISSTNAYQLVSFPVDFALDGLFSDVDSQSVTVTDHPLNDPRPHFQLRQLFLVDGSLYMLTEKRTGSIDPATSGRFWRIPLGGYNSRQSISVSLVDDTDRELVETALLPVFDPLNRAVHWEACVHVCDQDVHHFRVARLNTMQAQFTGEIKGVGARREHIVRLLTTQQGYVVANMTQGNLVAVSDSKVMERPTPPTEPRI